MMTLTEARDQLAEIEQRRQKIAEQAAVPSHQHGDSILIAPTVAAGMPAAGYVTAPMAVKAAEPEIAKRRKDRSRRDRKGHEPAQDDAATGAADQGRGYLDAMDHEASRKSFRERGATEGPESSPEPGRIAAAEFDRGYLSAGHGSESPMSAPPRQNPINHGPQGILQPIALPRAPVVGYVPAHMTQAVSMSSPSDR